MSINYEKLIRGEPEFGSIYDEKELSALYNEYNKYNSPQYNPKITIQEFELNFSKLVQSKYAIATNSGMSSLEILLQSLLNKKSVILTNILNFAGTHISIINNNHQIIFCESDESLNSNIYDLYEKIKIFRPDLLLLTNMNGLSHNEKVIKEFINIYSPHTKIIMDCCRSLCSKHNSSLENGTYSDATFYSFQRKKQITTLGEGGMIATNNKEIYEQCLKIRSFGYFEQNGQNYKITGAQAAVGIEQIKKISTLNNKRRNIANRRTIYLQSRHPDFIYPINNTEYYNVFYLYSLLVPENWSVTKRDLLIKILRKRYKVGSVIANKPTYLSSKLISLNTNQRLKKSERIAERLICPIIHPSLTIEEEQYINESINNAIGDVYNV